jgi:16S rRNA (guanine527-N7)-methyltransferase
MSADIEHGSDALPSDRTLSLGELNVSRETRRRLQHHADLVKRWSSAINLVSRPSLDQIWQRHILDSAQLLPLAPISAESWRDIGSGAGFPGLVVAILAAELRPDLRMTLVEADRRKAAFLQNAARSLDLRVRILAARDEDLPAETADVVSARALAPLPRLLDHTARHLAPNGIALFPKGARYRQEIDAALASWRFRVQKHPSRSGGGGVILALDQLNRV